MLYTYIRSLIVIFSNGSVLYFHPAIIFISQRARILVSFYVLLPPDPIDAFAAHVASWDPRSCGIQLSLDQS